MDKALVLADRLKKLKDQVDSLATKQTEIQTIKGDQGPKGEQGDRGFDGAPGLDGRDGKDGKDGAEGKDGISVVKAEIAFDGSLVLYLSNGDQIDCGEVTPEKSKEVFQTIKNSGGSSPINIFTAVLPGLVPASGGGTTNFLRADGSFAAPPATAPAGSTTQIQFNNVGAFGATAGFSYDTSTSTFNIAPASTNVIIEPVAPTGAQTSTGITLRTKNASATNGAGGSIFFRTGAGLGTGASGTISFLTGSSSNTSGGFQVTTGSGTNQGGGISFQTGSGTGTNGFGGSINFQSGIANGTGSAGSFGMTGGTCTGTGSGGDFAMFGGGSFFGVGGNFQLAAGYGAAVSGTVYIGTDSNTACFTITEDGAAVSQMGFFNATPVAKPVVTGSRATGAALVSLLTQLASLGLITDSTTA